MVSINNSTPIQPTVPVTPAQKQPPVETTTPQTSTTDAAAEPAAGEAAPAEAVAEAADTGDGKTSTTETQAATPDLVISKEMAETLSSDQIQGLIDKILADGSVTGDDGDRLTELNNLLKMAARKNDGKVDDAEDSLLDAVDSRGLFGTNKDVVKSNLQALKQIHVNEANQVSFDGVGITTQDGVSGFFGGKQVRALKLEEGIILEAPDQENATSETAPTGKPLSDAQITEKARKEQIAPILEQNKQNETALTENLQNLKTAINERVSSAAIQEEIKNLVKHSVEDGELDLPFVVQQAKTYGIPLEALTQKNEQNESILTPEDLENPAAAKLSGSQISALNEYFQGQQLTEAQVSAYKNDLNQVIDQALANSPLSGESYETLKTHLYDKNYLFENNAKSGLSAADKVSSEDQALYAQYKIAQENYEGSQKSAELALNSLNKPVSIKNLGSEVDALNRLSEKAESATAKTITDIEAMLSSIEQNPEQFNHADTKQLRSDLNKLMVVDAQGNPVKKDGEIQVKTPITQEHLNTVNEIWASLEEVGMQAGIAQNKGNITADYLANNPQAAQSLQSTEAGKLLASNPELAQYADLIQQLDASGNEALKAALFGSENPEAAVNQLLADHNSAWINELTSSFGSWNLCGFSPTLFGTAGGALAGGLGSSVGSAIDNQLAQMCGPVNSPSMDLNGSFSLAAKPEPQMLKLGSFTTTDVRNLLNLVKGSDENSQALRESLAQNGSELKNTLTSESMTGLQEQLAVKEQFDKVFWGSNSQLEKAQLAIETSLNQQSRVASDLAVATAQVEAALANSPADEGTRKGLEQQLALLKTSQQNLSETGNLGLEPMQTQQLQGVFDIVGKEDISNGPALMSLAKTQSESAELMAAMGSLQTTMSDPEALKQIIGQFPAEQQAQIQNLLGNQEILSSMSETLMSENSSSELGENMKQTLMSFSQAVELAKAGDTQALIELGNQPMNAGQSNSPTLFSNLNQMSSIIDHVNQFEGTSNESKGIYAAGLTEYFFAQQSQGVSLDEAWANLETDNVVAKTIQGRVEEEHKLKNNDEFQKQQQTRVDKLAQNLKSLQQEDPRGQLLSSLNSNLKYEDLSDLDSNSSRDLLSSIDTKLRQTPAGSTTHTQLSTLRNTITEAQSIRDTTRAHSTLNTRLSDFETFGQTLKANHERITSAAETFLAEKTPAINAAFDGQLFNGQTAADFLRNQIGNPNPDSTQITTIIDTLRQGNREQQHLATQLSNQFRQVSAANIQAKAPAEILANPNDSGVGQLMGFAADVSVLSDWAHNRRSEDVADATTAVELFIEKYQNQIDHDNFNQEDYLREKAELMARYPQAAEGTDNSPPPDAFTEMQTQVTGFQQMAASGDEEVLAGMQDVSDSVTDTISGNLAALASPDVTVLDFSSGALDNDPVFQAQKQQTANTFSNTSLTEMVSDSTAFTSATNNILIDVFSEAERTGDFSFANMLRDETNLANQNILSMYNDSLSNMSTLTGIPQQAELKSSSGVSEIAAKSAMNRAAGAEAEARAAVLVEEANSLANKLVLAPKGQDSTELLSELINGFINTIRDQDYKTRQLIMAQLANQMMTDSITHFYKDKTDKNNKYHQDSIERMADSFQRNIQRTIQESLVSSASDNQTIAAVSGQVGAANTAEAMGLEQLRVSTEQMINEAQKMTPPLITDMQKERILSSLFDSNPNNDALGIVALAGLPALN